MEDKQKRKYNAAVNGLQALDNHASDYAGNTPMINKRNALKLKIGDVEKFQQKQQIDISGEAVNKGKLKTDMGTKAWEISKPLAVFAKDIDDDNLLEAIDFEKSDFLFTNDADAKDRAKLVHDKANDNLAALTAGGYQIDAGLLNTLAGVITKFESAEGRPRAAESDTVAATEDLRVAIKDMEDIKQDILDLSVGYASTKPSLYNAIQDAFEIEDIGVRHRAMRIVCSDSFTNVRLGGVTISIPELGLEKKSSQRGIVDFSDQQMAEGNYTVKASRSGYDGFNQSNVAVFKKKVMKVNAVMVKI